MAERGRHFHTAQAIRRRTRGHAGCFFWFSAIRVDGWRRHTVGRGSAGTRSALISSTTQESTRLVENLFLKTDLEPRLAAAREADAPCSSWTPRIFCWRPSSVGSGATRGCSSSALNADGQGAHPTFFNRHVRHGRDRLRVAPPDRRCRTDHADHAGAQQRGQMVRALARQLGIELLFLPSHSPNQHLIKRLGKFTKKRAPHSRHHINDASIDTCLDQLPTTHHAAADSQLPILQ